MSISEHFRYRNDVFQSDIFVSDIGITDVNVGCRISPTLRSMSMPTYVQVVVKSCPVLQYLNNLLSLSSTSMTLDIFCSAMSPEDTQNSQGGFFLIVKNLNTLLVHISHKLLLMCTLLYK
jgi:hypothetical protein